MVEKNADGTYSAKLGDKTFQFSKWGAEKQMLVFAELSKLASYGLGDALTKMRRGMDDDAIGALCSAFIKGIGDGLGTDPQKTVRLLKQFCCDGVFCEGKEIPQQTFDVFFRDDVFFAFEVARANMEVQYSGFFERLSPITSLIRTQVASVIKPLTKTT